MISATLCSGACDTHSCVSSPLMLVFAAALTHSGTTLYELSTKTNIRWQTCCWLAHALVVARVASYDQVGRVLLLPLKHAHGAL